MTILETVLENKWQLAATVVIIYFARVIVAYSRLSQFRGPSGVGFSEVPHSWQIFRPDTEKWYKDVTDTYGPIARIGPNTLITSDPDVWMRVMNKPAYKKTDWYFHAARIEHRRDNVFTMTDNAEHERRRKAIAPGYSGRDIENIEPAIDLRVQDFLDLIRNKYLSTPQKITPMDLSKKMQFFTLDVLSTVGLGKSFGMLVADRDISEFVKSGEDGMLTANMFLALGLSGLAQMPFIGKFILPSPRDSKGMGKLVGNSFLLADQAFVRSMSVDSSTNSDSMLGSWIRHGIMGDALRSEAAESIIAGSDTTAGALRGIMLQLMANPRVYVKLHKEIDEAVEKGLVPEEGIISTAAARQMPYLQAFIREGMRWWPSVTNLFPRDVPPEGDVVMVDGKEVFLPGGAELGLSMLGMMHHRGTFGEDADCFRPERWTEAEPEKYAAMQRVSDLGFGYGKWACLGKPIAQHELGKGIFELMRNFDWALNNPTEPWKATNTLGLFVIQDLWVQVTERKRPMRRT
ncbi:Pisatin demethylase [Naviculisporaceae sp. PSN 640]